MNRAADSRSGEGRSLKVLGASGQLGYGIPADAFWAGIAARPDVIGVDMGSTDPGPFCLGSGEMMVTGEALERDLEMALTGAREAGVPILMGSAGTAGRNSQLAQVVSIVEGIARRRSLRFTLAVIESDIDPNLVAQKIAAGKVKPCGDVLPLSAEELRKSSGLVCQMGPEPFQAALNSGADVVIAGRSCDTSMFAAVPLMQGFDRGLTMHMSKLIECTSAIAEPGGRDAALATLFEDRFVVESMNPSRVCTPVSVAAHSLYEQADPYLLGEPGGAINLTAAEYVPVDDRRVAVSGSAWLPSDGYWLKLEGAKPSGHRFIAMGGIRDPRLIAEINTVAEGVRRTVYDVFDGRVDRQDYQIRFRFYGRNGVMGALEPSPVIDPQEMFVLMDVVARTRELAKTVCGVAKQYLLHLHYPGILCTSGNLAQPFSPDFMDGGPVFEFNVYHLMEVDDPLALFPIRMQSVG
jgi:hypothetical protein